ncbi:metallophosphoesterase [Botrimarina hoheduenensis]|uniref:metallophosphoesterase n=1 Tax=Botrimarina hoheduenensis TaxID=2528000 RepID=UPI0018D35E2F|nr:metallophosphoesterase [Botrimarina hoheduenensis]
MRNSLRATAAGAVGLGLYSWQIEPHWVEIIPQTMPLVGLPAALAGRRIVQVSDLHVGEAVDNDYLRATLRAIADLKPDYLALTGDFMTANRFEHLDRVMTTLAEAPIAEVPTFACLGNHDFGKRFRDREIADRLTDRLDSAGVRVLRNASVEIDGLQWAGSGDLWAGECDVWNALDTIDTSRGAILLAHNPDIADVRGYRDFRGWILSGHTHGGQVRFPLLGSPVVPVKNRRYKRGHVRLDASRDLYVNRGLGHSLQVRLLARPEVTVYTLAQA